MLPDALFSPLDLSDVLDETEQAFGARGVVDLLVAALSDRRVRSDADIDRYLDALKSACRQTRRYRDAVPVVRRIAVLNPSRRYEVVAELAVVHGHLGEPARGISMLESAYAEQQRLPPGRRCLDFCVAAEIAAMVLRHPALARRIAAIGRSVTAARPLAFSIDQPMLPVFEEPAAASRGRRPSLAIAA